MPATGAAARVCTTATMSYDGCSGTVNCPADTTPAAGTCSYTGCNPAMSNSIPSGWECAGVQNEAGDAMGGGHAYLSVECCREGGGAEAVPLPPKTETKTETNTETKSGGQTVPPKERENPLPPESNAFEASTNLLSGSAGQTLTVAALDCLDGSNQALKNVEAGEALVGNCISNLTAGEQMKKNAAEAAKRGGKTMPELKADPAQLESERAIRIFTDFEKNFGESGEDYVKKLVGQGFSREEIEEFLKKKLKPDQVTALLDAAEEKAKEKGGLSGLVLEKTPKGKETGTGLRDKLKTALAAKDLALPKAVPKEENRGGTKEGVLQSLTPLEDQLFKGSPSEDSEATLFDIIHLKYRSKWEMLNAYLKKK